MAYQQTACLPRPPARHLSTHPPPSPPRLTSAPQLNYQTPRLLGTKRPVPLPLRFPFPPLTSKRRSGPPRDTNASRSSRRTCRYLLPHHITSSCISCQRCQQKSDIYRARERIEGHDGKHEHDREGGEKAPKGRRGSEQGGRGKRVDWVAGQRMVTVRKQTTKHTEK